MSMPTRMQCRHILASGLRCGSPALKAENFCYYHHTTRRPLSRPEVQERRGHQSTFALPSLEDRTAVQLALGEVLARIASHDIDTKRAGLLLYGLQIALSSLPRQAPQPASARTPEPVDEVIEDEQNGPLAPIAEFQRAEKDKSLEQILLEQWHRDAKEELARHAAAASEEEASVEEASGAEPGAIHLHAVAAAPDPPQIPLRPLTSFVHSVVRFPPKSPHNPNRSKTLPQFKGDTPTAYTPSKPCHPPRNPSPPDRPSAPSTPPPRSPHSSPPQLKSYACAGRRRAARRQPPPAHRTCAP